MPAQWVLGLDIGTSSVRAAGYTTTGAAIPDLACQVHHTPNTTSDGGSEFAADALCNSCMAVLRGTLDLAHHHGYGSPQAVAACTFWHSLVGIDAAGHATTPVYLWADARSAHFVGILRQRIDSADLHRRTGCVPHTSYLPARLMWLRATHPDATRATKHWLAFADYLYLQLFGVLATGWSMASGSGLFNQNDLCWDPLVCAACATDIDTLPPLVSDDYTFRALLPPYRHLLPELAEVPWFPAAGDGACSNVGSGCVVGDRLALMVGTSGALRMVQKSPHCTPARGLWCYRVDGQRFVLGAALSNGGNLLEWLRQTLQLPSIAACEQELAEMAPDAHGLTILPLLAGERSPGWAEQATGAIVGLRLHTTPLQMLQASLEAICLRFAAIYALLPPAGQVIATGGAILHSPAWMQMMADVLGVPLHASAVSEASCRGAVLLALERLGYIDDVAAMPPHLRATYQPRPAITERYQAARLRQAALYAQLIGSADLR